MKESKSVSRSVVSDFLQSCVPQPTRLLCPWDSSGKKTGVGSHSFLQGIFPTQGLNLGFLHCRQILYLLSHQGSPYKYYIVVALVVKNPPTSVGDIRDVGPSLGWEDPLEEGMATHSRILAWRIPWTEEPGGLQSIGSQRVGHN